MHKKLVLFITVLAIGLLVAACSPAAKAQDTMMENDSGKDAMMEATHTPEMMDEKSDDAMMDKTEEPMMDEKSDDMMMATHTPEMMDDQSADAMMEATHTPEMMDEKSDDAMMDKTEEPMMDEKSGDMMMAPAWFAVSLTSPVTGEAFKIEDFNGKVVLLQNFAQWCPTCLSQQKEIAKLHEMMGMSDDLVTVSLDVDPNENAATLKTYLEKYGFDWNYAVAPAEVTREISDLYGNQFLNPPSAPMMIIDRHGEVHPLPFGLKSADDLQNALKPYLSDGM